MPRHERTSLTSCPQFYRERAGPSVRIAIVAGVARVRVPTTGVIGNSSPMVANRHAVQQARCDDSTTDQAILCRWR
jgi:hypothetical protein